MSADRKLVTNENLSAFAEALAEKVPLKSDLPTKVSDLANDRGFTNNTGTITSVTINGTTTSSGDVNLGYLVGAEAGKGLSTNDYTTAEKNKLGGIDTGAQVNTIETVKVNGTALVPDANKAVDVSVPTALSELSDDSTHRLVSDTEKTTWSGKQDALTFDTVPTQNSTNPVTSGGLYTVITQNELTAATALNDLNDRVSDLEEVQVPNVDQYPTEDSTNAVSSGGVYKVITDNEYAVSLALSDLNSRISSPDQVPTENSSNLISSGAVYSAIIENEEVAAAALSSLDSRVSSLEDDLPRNVSDLNNDVGVATESMLEDYVLMDEYEEDSEVVAAAINELNTRVSNIEDAPAFTESDPIFSASAAAGITSSDITNWNSKTSNTGTLTGVQFNGTDATVSNGVASITASIPDVANYFDEVAYDSGTKRINFKHGETIKKYIDATDFIKDGMVDSVEIATPESGDNAGVSCLVVTFNTDAGKEDIEIPLSSIFNPTNYYTKSETDSTFVKVADIDSVPTENSSNPVSSGGVYTTIAQSEYVISTSLNDLNTRVSGIEGDLYEGSGYLSLSGGEMDDNAEIVIPTYYNGDIITSNTLSPAGVSLINGGTEGYFGANYVILSDSTGGQSEFHPDGILFSSSTSDAEDGIGTTYKNGEISKKIDSSTEYTFTLPSKSGTLALTSNLVWSPSTGTKSARLAPNSTVSGSYSAACGAYSQILGSYSFTNGAYTKTYGIGALASGCFVSAANGNGAGVAFGGNYASGIVLSGDADATTYTGTISDSQLKFLLDNYYSSNVTSAFVNGGFIYDSSLFIAKITAFSYSSGTLTITFDRTLSSTAISNKSYNLVVCISGGEASTTFTGFTSNNARWSLAGGRWSVALQEMAFSWGNMSVANAQTSFALGHYAQTKNLAETGLGRYNKSTYTSSTFGNAGNTAFSVGIGSSHSARKNAIEIMQNGDLYVTGVGSYDGTNYSSASTLQSVLGTIPAAVTESTVSGWGFTKNTGTLTGVSFNGAAATVSNGVATISGTYLPLYNIGDSTYDAGNSTISTGISKGTASIILNLDGEYNRIMVSDSTTQCSQLFSNELSLRNSSYVSTTYCIDHISREVGAGIENNYTYLFPGSSGTLALTSDIPAAVTESTVSGWGFTKNSGTYSKPSGGIPASDLASAVQTSLGKADTALQSFTETDPVFSASAAAGITASDITNWNSKTSNTGTLTGVKVNGSNATVTSGVADIGTVITSETQLSKGTTTGSGNAVTDISVSNHQITLTKGSTFLTSHQSIKTINNQDITGSGNITLDTLPTVSASDNGKILMVVNGAWTLVSPVTIYSGSGEPNNSMGNNGDIYLQT